MYWKAIEEDLWFVPDQLKTREICAKAVHREPSSLEEIPDHLKTQKMFDE